MAMNWLAKFLGHKGAQKETSRDDSAWRTELSKNKLTKEEFRNLCVFAAREFFPEALIEPIDSGEVLKITPKNGEPYTAYLENIWRISRNDGENRVSRVERLFRVLGARDATDLLPQPDSIVPVIKDEQYLNIARKSEKEEASLVYEHLVADLWVVYCIDKPEAILTLKPTSLRQMQLEEKNLRAMAIENLRRILPPVECHGDGPVYMLTAGGDYVASLLLFDDLWEKLAATVNGEIVAAVPTRDVVLFTSSTSSEGIIKMRQTVTRLIETGGYLISTTMLRRHHGGWKVFS